MLGTMRRQGKLERAMQRTTHGQRLLIVDGIGSLSPRPRAGEPSPGSRGPAGATVPGSILRVAAGRCERGSTILCERGSTILCERGSTILCERGSTILCERGSTILTSSLAFGSWDQAFAGETVPTAAMLDRMPHTTRPSSPPRARAAASKASATPASCPGPTSARSSPPDEGGRAAGAGHPIPAAPPQMGQAHLAIQTRTGSGFSRRRHLCAAGWEAGFSATGAIRRRVSSRSVSWRIQVSARRAPSSGRWC